jgi:hypothetical protein
MAIEPQTENAISFANVNFEFQVDGDASPTDASGHLTSIELSGVETQIGEGYTANGDYAILTAGKQSPAEVTVNSIYTSTPTEIFKKLWDAKVAKKKVKFIWYPEGNASGKPVFETDYGYLTSVSAPVGDASSADPVLTSTVLKTPKITPDVVA